MTSTTLISPLQAHLQLPPLLLSPLDIKFSQTRIRAEFQDGRTVAETMEEMVVESLPDDFKYRTAAPTSKVCETDDAVDEKSETEKEDGDESGTLKEAENSAGQDDTVAENGTSNPPTPSSKATSSTAVPDGDAGTPSLVPDGEPRPKIIKCPFPAVEVIRWRCKLREADGSAKVDKEGLELYSHEAHWFTFDNRRLYCLQNVAMKHWPERVVCEVLEVPTTLARTRELRKFDTRTFGSKVQIGRRDTEDLPMWCWRLEAGLEEEAPPEDGIAKEPSLRRRRRMAPPPPPPPRSRRGGRRNQRSNEGQDQGKWDLVRSATLFCMIYLGLRVVVSLFRKYKAYTGDPSDLVDEILANATQSLTPP